MSPRKTTLILFLFTAVAFGATEAPDPKLRSIFPLGCQQGAKLAVAIRGTGLTGAYAIFGSKDLIARVVQVDSIQLEEVNDPSKKSAGHHVLLQMEIAPAARLGAHSLRLVTPQGVSNAIDFRVDSDPCVMETQGDHDTPARAEALKAPSKVNGTISKKGEVDYYSIDATAGQTLTFDVVSNVLASQGKYDCAELTLYELSGSWFDPSRLTRVAFANYYINKQRLTYRFPKTARYYLQVSLFMGTGSPDFHYQLRTVEGSNATPLPSPYGSEQRGASDWRERAWNRELELDRLQALVSRAVWTSEIQKNLSERYPAAAEQASKSPHAAPSSLPPVTRIEEDQNKTNAAAPTPLALPVLIEGSISRPGEEDTFPLKVAAGQKVAFEIETPDITPPDFNPKLSIVDGKGTEILSNIYRRVGGDGTQWVKSIEPKTIYTFEQTGEYRLQIKDVTARFGDPRFRYRVLIRPEIPHVGAVRMAEDHVNVVVGQASRLTFSTEQEEGFGGLIAVEIRDLPAGVSALPASAVEPEKPPEVEPGPKDRYLPRTTKTVVVVVAGADAQVTRTPQLVRISARPVVDGKLGTPVLVGEIPLMVVQPPDLAPVVAAPKP